MPETLTTDEQTASSDTQEITIKKLQFKLPDQITNFEKHEGTIFERVSKPEILKGSINELQKDEVLSKAFGDLTDPENPNALVLGAAKGFYNRHFTIEVNIDPAKREEELSRIRETAYFKELQAWKEAQKGSTAPKAEAETKDEDYTQRITDVPPAVRTAVDNQPSRTLFAASAMLNEMQQGEIPLSEKQSELVLDVITAARAYCKGERPVARGVDKLAGKIKVKLQIDQLKRKEDVEGIVNTDYFQNLREQAKQMRAERTDQ